jgi:hypothetical protein
VPNKIVCIGIVKLAFVSFIFWSIPSFSQADEESLIRVKRPDGTESPLLSKVVVTSDSATLVQKPGEKGGQLVPPFSVYFRLKTSSGGFEEAGSDGVPYWRVGDSRGTPLGWIRQIDRIVVDGKPTDRPILREWNSRYLLDPVSQQEQWAESERFRVMLPEGEPAILNAMGAGQTRYAFVSGAPKGEGIDETFPVFIYTGKTGGRTVKAEGTEILDDLKLEVAFVIESTELMGEKYDDRELKDYCSDIVNGLLQEISERPKLKPRVRIALVEYQDTMISPKQANENDATKARWPLKGASFIKRITQPLTDNHSEIRAAMDRLDAAMVGGDWPEDGIAGLHAAITELNWTPNSCKHVVLIGTTSLQDKPKGSQASQFGGTWNSLTALDGLHSPYGWSSTGLNIPGLVALAHPTGGQDAIEKVMRSRTLHAMQIGRIFETLDTETLGIRDKIVKGEEEFLNAVAEKMGSELVFACFGHYIVTYQRELAEKQYRQLAANDGQANGFFAFAEATGQGVTTAAQKMAGEFETALVQFDKVANNQYDTTTRQGADDAFAGSLYTIANVALAAKLKAKPAIDGMAETRNESGREVAQLRVMVGQEELQVLRAKLDAIQERFEARTKKSDRQNVEDILTQLQQAIAGGASGQTINAESNLQELITDLPLKTPCLRTTATDIASMSPEEFKNWLSQISYAVKRCGALLDDQNNWTEVGAGVAQKFAFLRREELP